MSSEQNKDVIRRWVEGAWNGGNLDLVDELYTPDYRPNWMPPPFPMNGDGLKAFVAAYRAGMPDLRFTIEDMVAEGERVAWRFTAAGTQTGEFMGIPPTYRSAIVGGTVIARFENGRYAEDWVNFDQFGMLQQLGVIPAPEGTPVA